MSLNYAWITKKWSNLSLVISYINIVEESMKSRSQQVTLSQLVSMSGFILLARNSKHDEINLTLYDLLVVLYSMCCRYSENIKV